jgi:prefoldin subunit 5
MPESVSSSERIVASYKRLAESAQALSSKSNEFSKAIAILDAVLQKLQLGVTAWERIHGSDDDGQGNYWSQDVGYAKIDGAWGIAIREKRGNHHVDEAYESSEWLLNDAPRPLRIDAVDKLPELIDKLVKNADKTARKIDEKLSQVKGLAACLNGAATEVEQQRKGRRS